MPGGSACSLWHVPPCPGPLPQCRVGGFLSTKGRAGDLRWGGGAQVHPWLWVPLTPPCSLLPQCPPDPSLWCPQMTPQVQEAGRSRKGSRISQVACQGPSSSGSGSERSRVSTLRVPVGERAMKPGQGASQKPVGDAWGRRTGASSVDPQKSTGVGGAQGVRSVPA